jgi:hypothetical protein
VDFTRIYDCQHGSGSRSLYTTAEPELGTTSINVTDGASWASTGRGGR